MSSIRHLMSSSIIEQIQSLQTQEVDLYNQLESAVLAGKTDKTKLNEIIEKINQVATLKETLYQNLAVDLKQGRDRISSVSDQLERDIEATQVIEQQVQEARQRASKNANIRGSKTRLIELGMYEAERYQVHKNYLWYLILFFVGLIAVIVLLRYNVIPSVIGSLLISLLIVGAIIMSIYQLYDMSQRSSLDYSKYNWGFDPAQASKNYETVWEHDKNALRTVYDHVGQDIRSGIHDVNRGIQRELSK